MMDNDLGLQPLDAVMIRLGLTNADVVKASVRQLTFKMIQKGRKGRRLTPNIQHKILEAFHVLKPEEKFTLKDFFNY